MSKFRHGLFGMLCLLSNSPLLAEEWVGLDVEPPTILGIGTSGTDQQSRTTTLYLTLPMAAASALQFDYSQATFVDDEISFDSDNLFLGFDAEVDAELEISLNYQFQGQLSEIEIEQYGIQLNYAPQAFNAMLGYSLGEVRLFTREDIRPAPITADFFQSDMNVIEIGLDYWFDNMGFGFLHQLYDYEKRGSLLVNTPRLQIRVKPGVLAQSGLLLAEQSSLSFQSQFENSGLSLNWSASRSELDDSRVQYLQVNWIEYFGDYTALILSVGVSDEDEWLAGLGLEWIR